MFIDKIIISTHVLSQMKSFYTDVLQFPSQSVDQGFAVAIGDSILECHEVSDTSEPFYHFAFNIPANQFEAAKTWASERVELTEEDGQTEVYFDLFDVYSFYFVDPAGNIVEFISRQSGAPVIEGTFSSQMVLGMGEINVTTPDLFDTGQRLLDWGIPTYRQSPISEGLNFLGAESSFLLLGIPDRKWLFSYRKATIYPLTIVIDHYKQIEINAQGQVQLSTLVE